MSIATAPTSALSMPTRQRELETLIAELESVRESLLEIENSLAENWNSADITKKFSAQNLVHYIALRRHDLRDVQLRLTSLGLSSLGRAEAHVLANLDAVLGVLRNLTTPALQGDMNLENRDAFKMGHSWLHQRTNALLGVEPNGRNVRIMVTMPSNAASNENLVCQMLGHGMDCMRINCAHDSPQDWLRMITNLRKAEKLLGRSCRILMDLPGPKLRTGSIECGPQVLRIHPKRDSYGHVVMPVRIWLHDGKLHHESFDNDSDVSLSVSSDWLARLATGDSIKLVDTADRDRRLEVIGVEHGGVWAQCSQTTFVMSGTVLEHCGKFQETLCGHETEVKDVPNIEGTLLLHKGDMLLICGDQKLGRAPIIDAHGTVIAPAQIGCTLPEVLNVVSVGESVWFDDGKIGGIVERNDGAGLLVRITHARPNGEKLRSDKGINFPDTRIDFPALTALDKEYLKFVVEHADIVALSFANSEEDVRDLIAEIGRLNNTSLGIVLKIETKRGFENLPNMLLEAMQAVSCGVMIARGDLAVECGYQRMAEIQEEILWICEAAHTPVIWATQVLETLVRDGIPSRAEITDAAMGHRSECVMLNKGPHILEALSTLDDILRRMETHQDKKRPQLRELKLARLFCYSAPGQ